MTVKELKEIINFCNENIEVFIALTDARGNTTYEPVIRTNRTIAGLYFYGDTSFTLE
ncbi:hypothetical protein LCGC14_0415710 [marine sediment metagenome]|uniref:Uncharacterized protein n=1 Tax=marine sediment metagenome TaxID=412755 RepID=A0A0F9SSG0_9ZZZZ